MDSYIPHSPILHILRFTRILSQRISFRVLSAYAKSFLKLSTNSACMLNFIACIFYQSIDMKFHSAYLANASQKVSVHIAAIVVWLPDSLHIAAICSGSAT